MTITAGQIKGIVGREIGSLTFLTRNGDEERPLQVQIDRKDRTYSYVFTQNRQILEAQDELTFLIDDLPENCPDNLARPDESPLILANGKDSRYCFLVRPAGRNSDGHISTRDDKPILSLTSDGTTDRVSTPYYRIGFSRSNPLLLTEYSWGDPVRGYVTTKIAGMKIKLDAKIFGFIPYRLDQDDFTVKLLGTIEGGVRITRVFELSLSFLSLFVVKRYRVVHYYYPNSFLYRFAVPMPRRMRTVFNDLAISSGIDFEQIEDDRSLAYIHEKLATTALGTSKNFSLKEKGRMIGLSTKYGIALCRLDGMNEDTIKVSSEFSFDGWKRKDRVTWLARTLKLFIHVDGLIDYGGSTLDFGVDNIILPPLANLEQNSFAWLDERYFVVQ